MAPSKSRLAALALAILVVLVAGAPSAAAKKGSHGHQRKELRLQERSAKKGSRGHHRVLKSAKKDSKSGHHGSRAPGKKRHGPPHRDGRDTRAGTSAGRSGAAGSTVPRLRIPTHDRIDVPGPKARKADRAARPLRARPIRAWHPTTIRAAAVETGRALAFPMALSLLALGFILGHSRLDARDPKLARAPVNQTEQLVAFE